MISEKIAEALQLPVTEKETKQLARICQENEFKATTQGALAMLEECKDSIGYEAYVYWSHVALELPE